MLLTPIQPTPWFSNLRLRWKKPVRHDLTGRAAQMYQIMRRKPDAAVPIWRRAWNKLVGRPTW